MSHRAVCCVPSVSAVAVRDLDRQEDLCANIDDLPRTSPISTISCSRRTTARTLP